MLQSFLCLVRSPSMSRLTHSLVCSVQQRRHPVQGAALLRSSAIDSQAYLFSAAKALTSLIRPSESAVRAPWSKKQHTVMTPLPPSIANQVFGDHVDPQLLCRVEARLIEILAVDDQ